MFQKILDYLRQVVSKLFPKDSIDKAINVDINLSNVMASKIDLWTKMYQDMSHWIDNDVVYSMNLPSAIASEFARLVTLEMKSEITGSQRADYLNEQYIKVMENIRIQTEYAAAKGGLIFKPYPDGNNIAVDYVQADRFYPIKFDSSGELVSVIFTEQISVGKKVFTRIEHHELEDDVYIIKNKAFCSETGNDLGYEVPLSKVREWDNLEEETIFKGIEKPLFSYFKMPLANAYETESDIGVSVYSKAEKLIEQADKQYSRILWEFSGGELAIDADYTAIQDDKLPAGKKRLFRKLDIDKKDESFYSVFNPEIRDTSYFNGLNKLLQRIEFNCGLAYGTLSDVQETAKTATEIKTSKQRSYATVTDIQKSLQKSLDHLIFAMDAWTTIMKLAPKGDYKVSFEFDDSLIVDSGSDQAIMMQEVAAGLIKPEIYLMRRYGLTEKQCKDWMPAPVMNSEFEEEE